MSDPSDYLPDEETAEKLAQVIYEDDQRRYTLAHARGTWDGLSERQRGIWREEAHLRLIQLNNLGLLVAPSTSDGPRTWTLPAEPGPEVTTMRDSYGRRWDRGVDVWRSTDGGYPYYQSWATLVLRGPLTDGTAEATS